MEYCKWMISEGSGEILDEMYFMIKQWIVLFRKMFSYNCDGVCIQIE